jgi:EAL and modified HD-GYP domain-containing signal transduction protein
MDVNVARQPIYNAHRRVLGYELLYRSDAAAETAASPSEASRSGRVIVDAVLGVGLESLAGDKLVFINVDETILRHGLADVLDPDRVVLELLETVPTTPELVKALRELGKRGFGIALDDFEWRDGVEPLLELARYAKVDVRMHGESELARLLERLAPYDLKLVAEKVESAGEYARCRELGFELFQGYHHFRPETVSRRDLGGESLAVIRLMNVIRDLNASDRHIEEAFRSDPGLSYRLLRMVNSAALGGRGVDSIAHALRLMGREPLYRWLTLLLLASERHSELHLELVKSALFRARFMELVGDLARSPLNRSVPAPGSLFLAGLFSRMDQVLEVPMAAVLERVDLLPVVEEALLHRSGPAGELLAAVTAYESGRWDEAEAALEALGVEVGALADSYLEALAWSASRMALRSDSED